MSAGRRRSSLEAILRKPLMVAPQMPVLDLLLQMRMQRVHLALVVDEYGGIDGLVTIEDLVETITGDIDDEHDDVEAPMVTERPDGALDLNARMPIEDFEEKIGPILTEDERDADIDTVGGLVFTARRPGADARRGDQPPLGHGVSRAGRRCPPYSPFAGPACRGHGRNGLGGSLKSPIGVRAG